MPPLFPPWYVELAASTAAAAGGGAEPLLTFLLPFSAVRQTDVKTAGAHQPSSTHAGAMQSDAVAGNKHIDASYGHKTAPIGRSEPTSTDATRRV